MKHIAFAIVAAAGLAIIGPHLDDPLRLFRASAQRHLPLHALRAEGEAGLSQASTHTGAPGAEPRVPASMLRMRAGVAGRN